MTVEPKRYRKKPVQVEAILVTKENALDVLKWSGGKYTCLDGRPKIETLEGIMNANFGDYVIKGVNGEFYPCKPDIFEKTYELVESWEPPYDG